MKRSFDSFVVSGEQPLVVPFIPSLLEGVAHKKKEVQVAAENAGNAIIDILCPWAIRVVQSMLFAGAQETKWQVWHRQFACLIAKYFPVHFHDNVSVRRMHARPKRLELSGKWRPVR